MHLFGLEMMVYIQGVTVESESTGWSRVSCDGHSPEPLRSRTLLNFTCLILCLSSCSETLHPALLCEGGADVGQNRLVKTEVVEEFLAYAALLEVPEHTL